MAPADVRPLEFPLKVCGIQIVKYFLEIEVPPLRTCGSGTNAPAAHVMDASARAVRAGIFEIRRGKSGGSLASIHARKEQRSGAFEHGKRRAAQEIGEAHVNAFLAAPDGQHQTAVRVELDAKAWRAAFPSPTRKHPLGKNRPPGNIDLMASHSFFPDFLPSCLGTAP